MRVFLICFVSLFFFVNSTCAYRCDKDCKKLRYVAMAIALNQANEELRLEPILEPDTFEDAKCIDVPFTGTLHKPGSLDNDYFFLYVKSGKFKILRLKEFFDFIELKIYSSKENRILLKPISQIEIEITSQKDGTKYTAILEEYNTTAEPYTYLHFTSSRSYGQDGIYLDYGLQTSEKLDSSFDAELFLYRDSHSVKINKFRIFFEGEFSCSP